MAGRTPTRTRRPAARQGLFRLELDVSLHFVPPMHEHGRGIMFTRTIELPFPPVPKLIVYGKEIDDCPEPMGYMLKDLTWDLDREVFLAKSSLHMTGEPISVVPSILRSWVDRGWKFGSFVDTYHDADDSGGSDGDDPESGARSDQWEHVEDEDEKLNTTPPRRRPPEVNRIFKAIVRHMSETLDNESVAYAIDRTGVFFEDHQLNADIQGVARWKLLRDGFDRLSERDQELWRKRVLKYPRLDQAI